MKTTHLQAKTAVLAALGLALAALEAPAQFRISNRSILRPEPIGALDEAGSLAAAMDRAAAGVVRVVVEVQGRNRFEFVRPSSGALVSADGLVLTWQSLIAEFFEADDRRLFVELPARDDEENPTRLPATVAHQDPGTGLTLLKIDLPAERRSDALGLRRARARFGEPVGVLAFPDAETRVGFAGVASPCLGEVTLADRSGDGMGPRFAADEIHLTDAAIQRRCHGAALIGTDGTLLGLCNAEHAALEISEPTLEQLQAPSFGFVVPCDRIAAAFGTTLSTTAGSPPPTDSAVARAARSVLALLPADADAPAALDALDPEARQRRQGCGSATVVTSDGLALTNAHLVDGRSEVGLMGPDGRRWDAEVLRRNPPTNLALLRIHAAAGAPLPPAIALRRATSLRTGERLFALGNPQATTPVVAAGVFSAARGAWVQTDASLGNDNAGGALVDAAGRMVATIDGGRIDRIEMAYRRRGTEAKAEDSLNRTPGIDAVQALFPTDLGEIAADVAPPTRPDPLADTVERVAGSMLNVYIERVVAGGAVDDNPFAPAAEETTTVSLGSGVIITPEGLALTNWHVVDAATFPDGSPRDEHVVAARTRDGTRYDVEVLSISREEDLALVRLRLDDGAQVPAVELGASAPLPIGSSTLAIGNPMGQANTVTAGVVTAKDQELGVRGRWAKLTHLLETDAAINGGNSGGALLDARGRLIGINSAGGNAFNVTGFAIAIERVRDHLRSPGLGLLDDRILLTGAHKMRSVYLGIGLEDDDEGIVVSEIDPNGPAVGVDVRVGDRIRSLGGVPVEWSLGYAMRRRELAAGPVVLGIERDGTAKEIEVHAMSRAVWWVQRQLGVGVDLLTIREDAEAVRGTALAFRRAFTGDPTATRREYPGSLVRVARVLPNAVEDGNGGTQLRSGDLLLGVQFEVRNEAGTSASLATFETAEDLRAFVQEHCKVDGTELAMWIARDGEVALHRIETAKLLW